MIYQNKAWRKATGFKLDPTGKLLEPVVSDKMKKLQEELREAIVMRDCYLPQMPEFLGWNHKIALIEKRIFRLRVKEAK